MNCGFFQFVFSLYLYFFGAINDINVSFLINKFICSKYLYLFNFDKSYDAKNVYISRI